MKRGTKSPIQSASELPKRRPVDLTEEPDQVSPLARGDARTSFSAYGGCINNGWRIELGLTQSWKWIDKRTIQIEA